MTRTRGSLLAAAAAVVGIGAGVAATRATAGEMPQDRAGIEKVVHDYILAHPEIIPEAIQKLRDRETAKSLDADRAALEKPFAGAWAGSASPKVTLVMFTDYACGYCRASQADVAKLLIAHPDLRVVWREIPVLGPQSEVAARSALAAARAGHYLPFHRGLFDAGRPDDATIAKAARAAGLEPAALTRDGKSQDIEAEIAANLAIAGRIGVTGTPAFVVGDKFLSGAVGFEALDAAVKDAAKS